MNGAATSSAGGRYEYVDESVLPGSTYYYRVCAGRVGDTKECYGPVELIVPARVLRCALYQNCPNPFNPECVIRYDILAPCRVRLRVFDVNGSVVRTLIRGWREPGVYYESWDGCDDGGRRVPSGVYIYRLEAGDFVATRKMVLLQ